MKKEKVKQSLCEQCSLNTLAHNELIGNPVHEH